MFLSLIGPGRRSRNRLDRARRPRSFLASIEPVEDRVLMASISAVSWKVNGVEHTDVFTLGVDNTVWVDKDSTGLQPLSGYLESISAGLDDFGNPEIYGIGGNNAVWVNHLDGRGWSSLGGNVTAISATSDNTVFTISPNNHVYYDYGAGWINLGGYSTQISASMTYNGVPEVFAIGSSNSIYSILTNGSGWTDLGGNFSALSASTNGFIFALGFNNTVSIGDPYGFYNLGGYLKQISAGVDQYGNVEIYGIGGDNAVWVNHINGNGWSSLGGYVLEISAASNNMVFARGADVSQIFASSGYGFYFEGDMPLAEPGSQVVYLPAPAGVGLYSPGRGNQPSYYDVVQGTPENDCWLMASLAEVADRDPQDIKNMFVYEGIGVDDGISLAYYLVRLFNTGGTAFYVEVDTALPLGGIFYAQVNTDLNTSALWPALAEKAYAEANAFGYVGTPSPDNGTYASLNNDYFATAALQAITGNSASYASMNVFSIITLINDWSAGDLIVLATSSPSSSDIVSNHAYALVGYNSSSSQPFLIYNPWGTDSSGWVPGFSGSVYGQFTASLGFVMANFAGMNTDTGAASGTETVEVPDDPLLLNQGDATANDPQHRAKHIVLGAAVPSVSPTLA